MASPIPIDLTKISFAPDGAVEFHDPLQAVALAAAFKDFDAAACNGGCTNNGCTNTGCGEALLYPNEITTQGDITRISNPRFTQLVLSAKQVGGLSSLSISGFKRA